MIDSYDKLPLGKYKEIVEIFNEDITDFERQVKLVACLCDCDEDTIYDLPVNEYSKYTEKLDFLTKTPITSSKIPSRIKLNEHRYNIEKDIAKLTTGQFIDMASYMEQEMGIEYIISVVMIPEGKKYGEYDTNDVIKDILEMDLVSCLNLSNFFQKVLDKYINRLVIYLEYQMKKMVKMAPNPTQKGEMKKMAKTLKHLRENGRGLPLFTKLAILQDLIGSQSTN